jgi:oligogalacturonide lyase
MSRETRYPSESKNLRDPSTGVSIRQVTDHESIHHHPFFNVQAYDDAMKRLVFVSHRTGLPQIFAEEGEDGTLLQITDREDLNEWSFYPSHDGDCVYYTAGSSGWRVRLDDLEEERVIDFSGSNMREKGMVGAAMGTTTLSLDDRFWAIHSKASGMSKLIIVDTRSLTHDVILRRDSIGHIQFCPDDPDLIYYAGPLTDRVWVVNRDGSDNRRLYSRNVEKNEWITHESWIPGTCELAFVDWPRGIRCVNTDSGVQRRVTSFNAWHAICNRQGTLMVADTNLPDIGIQLFNPLDGIGEPEVLCHPGASNIGDHWGGPFPYANGPIEVYAPQHTHPHPSFSPDGRRIVFTSDRTGHSQIYEVALPDAMAGR